MLRYNASQIPSSDQGIFPKYWFHPYQIIIHKNSIGDIAILLRRKVSGKTDKITFRVHKRRIEETILPNLNYQKFPMWKISNDKHHIILQGGTFNIKDHPLFTIGMGSEVKLMNNRIEASVNGYPIEFELLWVLTFPNKKYFSKNRAENDAEYDFWGALSNILTQHMDIVLSKKLGEHTVNLFIKLLEKVRSELNNLISRGDLVEQQLQEFLERHYFLLYENKPLVKKTRKIGSYLSDFTLELSDGSILLVELQLNSDPIIINGKASEGFNEAIKQLNEWFEWIEKSEKSNIDKYSGIIIMGRKEDYDKHQETINKILSESSYPLKFRTYDDLNKNIDRIKDVLRTPKPSNKK